MMRSILAALVVAATALASPAVLAADASVPHEHQGKLKPFARPPKPLQLSDAEKATLNAGKVVMRQTEGEGGGRGLAVFFVDAPADTVWGLLREFKSYPKWISEVKKCDPYKTDGGKINVYFQLKSFPVTIEYYIAHDFNLTERWGTWTLDYTRQSDLDDSVGFWRVTPVDGQAEKSMVEYSIDIALKGYVPGFIRGILVDNGLKQATSWVKVQGEKRWAAEKAKKAETPAATPTP